MKITFLLLLLLICVPTGAQISSTTMSVSSYRAPDLYKIV